MKNKIIALFAALLMTFSFAACTSEGNSESAPETVTVTETSEPETETVSPEVPETPDVPVTPDTPEVPPANDIDALFLQVLREGTNSWDNEPDAAVIDLAKEMCGAWDRGANFKQIGGVLLDSGYPPQEAGYFVGAGTEAYCPEHSSKIG